MKKVIFAVMILTLAFAGAAFGSEAVSVRPGEVGFEEIPIGETQVGPYNVAAVYFRAVDMYPVGKGVAREDADLHLEADIHLKPLDAIMYGFGNGENIWPAYLTIKYQILALDGKTVVMEGSFMPMNADDGPHYGANIAKGLKVGQYKLKFIIEPPTDYLLHTDEETGVPAKNNAKNFFQTYTVTFDWNYTAEQLAD
ncbi:MAG: iron transporter [Synergistaceae bacterium]|nr:iron transporter [Synergistaceae bacterium]